MSALLESLLTSPPVHAGDPAWLREARIEALDDLRADALPTSRTEAWKYTGLRALEARRFVASDKHASTRAFEAGDLVLPGIDGPRLVFVNGSFRADLSVLSQLPAGLRLTTLAQELEHNPEALRFALERRFNARGEAFARLNTALASDGVLLRVAAGATIEQPIHLLHLGTAADNDVAWALRHVIEVGEDASLTLIEHHAGMSGAHLGNALAQVTLKSRARLRLVQVQDCADGATLIRRSEIEIGAAAEVDATTLEVGGALCRHDVVVRLSGQMARFMSRGCFALRGRQHCDTQLDVRHEARDTSCDLLWRGLADQRARGVFRCAITIAAGADGSAAALSNKNLLLSPHAEIDTQPVLEIHADEVQASHGATVGQLDERALFYLRSRGMPASQARAMLIAAFCNETLQNLSDTALRDDLESRLPAHLPHQAGA